MRITKSNLGKERPLPPTLSIEEAGRLLGYGRDLAYAAARAGVLPTILIGKKKRRVPTHRLLELLEGQHGTALEGDRTSGRGPPARRS